MFLVDSHCHLDMLDLTPDEGEMDRVIQRAKDNGVHYFLNVCVSLTDFPTLLRTAEKYPEVSVSVGLHPNEQEIDADADTLATLAAHPKVIAIGETGLDYFRSTGDLTWQRDRFIRHIEVAKRVKKPLIIHSRDANVDTLRLMRETSAADVGGVMHCFSEDMAFAKEAISMGFSISFSGTVTFKNALAIQEAAKLLPLDKILIETDSPYLAPTPKRGKPNEPAYVRYTAEYIAALRQIPLAEFAEQTTQNFFSLFKGAVRPHV